MRGTAEHFYTIPYRKKYFFLHGEFFNFLLYIWYIFAPHLRVSALSLFTLTFAVFTQVFVVYTNNF